MDRKEKDRLRKREERRRAKEKGDDLSYDYLKDKVIRNMNEGRQIFLSSIKKYQVTIDDVIDEKMIHSNVLKILKNLEEQKNTVRPPLPAIRKKNISKEGLKEIINREFKKDSLTKQKYLNNIDILIDCILLCHDDDIIKCFSDTKAVIKRIHEYSDNMNTQKRFLNLILILARDPLFRLLVDDENIKAYRDERNICSSFSDQKRIDDADNGSVVPWKTFYDLGKNSKDLLLSLYIYLPPVRDNYGKVYIVDDEEKLNHHENYYVTSSGRLILNNYKTVKTYGSIKITVPKKLKKIIDDSLSKSGPRTYLIEKEKGKIFNNGSLSAIIKESFGYGIVQLRRSFLTLIHQNHSQFKPSELKCIHWFMGHNSAQSYNYIRHESEDSGLTKEMLDDIKAFTDLNKKKIKIVLKPKIKIVLKPKE